MLVLTFSPFATVWLWFPPHSVGLQSPIPAFTFVLTFSPRDIVWLCWSDIPPAFTFVLTFIEFFLSLSLIAAGCRLPIQAKKECEIAGRVNIPTKIFSYHVSDSPSHSRL